MQSRIILLFLFVNVFFRGFEFSAICFLIDLNSKCEKDFRRPTCPKSIRAGGFMVELLKKFAVQIAKLVRITIRFEK